MLTAIAQKEQLGVGVKTQVYISRRAMAEASASRTSA